MTPCGRASAIACSSTSALVDRLDRAGRCPTAAAGAKRIGLPGLPSAAARRPYQWWRHMAVHRCVMDAWQRETHRNTAKSWCVSWLHLSHPGRVVRAVAPSCSRRSDDEAKALAERVMRSMPGHAPIVVNSPVAGRPQGLRTFWSVPTRRKRSAPACSMQRFRGTTGRSLSLSNAGWGRSPCSIQSTSATCSAPICRAHRAGMRSPTSSNSTTRDCAAARAAHTRRCTDLAGQIRDRSWQRSSVPDLRSSPVQTRDAHSTSLRSGFTSSTQWISSLHAMRGSMMAGRYDELIDRLQVVVDALDQVTFDALREAPRRATPDPSTTSGLHRRDARSKRRSICCEARQASTNELTVSINSR